MYQLMKDTKVSFKPNNYIGPVKGYYTTTDGKMLSLPYNASTQYYGLTKT